MSDPNDPYAAPDPDAPRPDASTADDGGTPPTTPPPGYAPGYAPQPGYGPPGQPPYSGQPYPGQPYAGQPYPGQPYPGQPNQPGWYPPPAAPKTNGLAIASLICSAGAFVVCITAPVGAILGFVALSQIKKTGEQGRGLALAGAWIGTAFTVLAVLAVAVITALAIWFWDDVSDDCNRSDFSTQQAYEDCLERSIEDRLNGDSGSQSALGSSTFVPVLVRG